MGRRDPFSDPVINFDRYKFSDKARGYLKDYLWGPKAVGYDARLSQAYDINAMARGFTPDQVRMALWAKRRANYLTRAAPKKQVDKKPAQKPAVKGGLGSQKKKTAPAKELKKIVSKKPVKPPKEIRRQTVFQPRGTRKQVRNPFTGNRPTL